MTEDGCTCDFCVEMCRTYPCLPLPEEAHRIIQAGLAESLMLDTLPSVITRGKILALRPAMVGHEGGLAPMRIGLAPCVFLQGDRCLLHAKGLKPHEGRMCRHDTTKPQEEVMMLTIREAWDRPVGQALARHWARRHYTGDPRWLDHRVLMGQHSSGEKLHSVTNVTQEADPREVHQEALHHGPLPGGSAGAPGPGDRPGPAGASGAEDRRHGVRP